MPGSFNIANAVCAYAVLRAAGVGADEAAAGIAAVEVPGRMQLVGARGGIRGIVDYAHSPDAIERVLRAAREDARGRVIAVLGAGGDRDRGKRPLMGDIAARLADVLVITDDNPRSEDPQSIRLAIRAGAELVAPAGRAELHDVGDRASAITVAVGLAESGDVVLVLGKGHEQGQEAAGVVTPFDDADVLRAALDARDGEDSSDPTGRGVS
jgi:UDP-N-acetylmuramoyl-L-alanyl-D-glutamate--2,6-diaminopimelate ligase